MIYGRIMLPVPGAGSMHFPKGYGYDARYFKQLTSERRYQRYSHGRAYYIYEAGDRRNEPLDIRVYALAAHRRVLFDAATLRAELATPVSAATETAPKTEAERSNLPADVGPKAQGLVFESAPLDKPTGNAGGFKLPDYVLMSQREGGENKGASIFKT